MASKKKKSWVEKLNDSKDLPKVIKIEGKMTRRWGEGTCVIPAPLEVDKLMRKIPKGKVSTINEFRQFLARKHKTNIACPITTGIFAWVAAHASQEEKEQGKTDTTPYWRTLKSEGVINEKYPGGIENQKKLLEMEGHKVIKKGKNKFIVENYEQSLADLN